MKDTEKINAVQPARADRFGASLKSALGRTLSSTIGLSAQAFKADPRAAYQSLLASAHAKLIEPPAIPATIQPARPHIQVIDFFCGCGGMSLGFDTLGRLTGAFHTLGGVDINSDAAATFEHNFRKPGIVADLCHIEAHKPALAKLLQRLQYTPWAPLVLIGCAPCQGFTSHRKKNWNNHDARNSLIAVFAGLAAKLQPDAIVMENVPEMLSVKYADYFSQCCQIIEQAGYTLKRQIYNTAAFGVPQERYRSLVLAMRRNFLLPKPYLNPMPFRKS